MPAATPDAALETNAYAISYRLLGDRPASRAVAGIAAERLRQVGGMSRPDWMYLLVEFTLNQTIEPGALAIAPNPDDPYTGLRTALRRRLERAAPDERVAGALVHLGGYPVEFVASVVNRSIEQTVALAGVLAPPPGIDYRDLGDPELTRRVPVAHGRGQHRRPHWTTVAVTVLVLLAVVVATQLTGPRPTLGPPTTEGGLGVELQAPPTPGELDTATG
ncbi:MAG: hypothetical protein V9E94_11570 [Microthrixaceae bacterium]